MAFAVKITTTRCRLTPPKSSFAIAMKIHAGRHSLPTNAETPAVSALEKSDKARHAQPQPTRSRQLRSAKAKGSNIGDAGGAGGATGGACAIPACIP